MIKEIAIISGKGGTGKTSIAGSLAYWAANKIMVDCDVDAADLHLIMNGKIKSTNDFIGSKKAEITPESCDSCGICTEYCRFDAIKEKSDTRAGNNIEFYIDKYSCEGCGVCYNFCPNEAIQLKDHISGKWYISDTAYGPLVHAKLGIAEANSGKLVSLLRKTAHVLAEKNNFETIIIDGPPGIGCPVIASLSGTSYVLIVTEPTLSAFHDMDRLIQLIDHFRIPCGLCINKTDINPRITLKIESFARERDLTILGKIAYDTNVIKAQVAGTSVVDYADNGVSEQIRLLWSNLQDELQSIEKKQRSQVYENRNTLS